MATLLIKNCRIVSPDYDVENAAVLVDGKLIKKIFVDGDQLPTADEIFDAEGKMLMPGFIDVHCHGKANCDFCDGSVDAITTMAKAKLDEGVTSLLPTTLTVSEEQLAVALNSAAEYVANGSVGCKVPGVHLEGPFINPKCLGAQNPAYVRTPDAEEVKRLNAIFPVLKVSYAVEMPNGPEFAADMIAAGITPSCVHSQATYAQFEAGHRHGLRNLSHFCNQMTPLHHRDIGLVGAGLADEDVFIEFICDKLHICPDMINLVFSIKNVEKIQLITDAMRAAGMPNGEYDLGGLPVIVSAGAARLKSNGALAGSTLKLNEALRNVFEITNIELKELVKTTSWNQTQALGLKDLGRIEPKYIADMVLLNDDFSVAKVWVDGVAKR
ncbi:MAG: N-acetylglucosamine-6-phosphate deacetylase [Lentisphaeria bacterium]|nr:N-acetylglucosamine-6-phosphate deacetylase [Lentisphaeria bacterium]